MQVFENDSILKHLIYLPYASFFFFESCVKVDAIETKKEAELLLNEEEDEIEEMVTLIIEEPKEKWDCESILSEYLFICSYLY